MMLRYLMVLLLVCLFSACIKWDLEKVDIINFDVFLNSDGIEIGENYDNDIVQNDAGEYLIVGHSKENRALIMNVSEDGKVISTSSFLQDGIAHAITRSVEENESYLVVGNSGNDLFVSRVSSIGLFISVDTFKQKINSSIGLVEKVNGRDVFTSSSGDYIITGTLKQEIGDERLLFLILDSSLQIKTLRTFNINTEGVSVIEDDEGNFVIGGFQAGKLYMAKINKEGVFQWQKRIEDTQVDSLTNVLNGTNGNYLIVGSKNSTQNMLVVEVEPNGELIYSNEYRIGEGFSKGYHITSLRDSTFLVGALSEGSISLCKINKNGDLIWQRHYENSSNSIINSVCQVKDFGFALFGISNSNNNFSYRLVKTDENGELRE